MNHDKEAIEAAKRHSFDYYKDYDEFGDTILNTLAVRDFLAGVKWERERIRERLREIKEIVDEELCAPSYKIQIDNNGYKTVTDMAEQEIRDSAHKVAVAIDSLLGEK